MIFGKKKKKNIIDLSEWSKLSDEFINSEEVERLTIGQLKKMAMENNWSVEILIREIEGTK